MCAKKETSAYGGTREELTTVGESARLGRIKERAADATQPSRIRGGEGMMADRGGHQGGNLA